MAGLGSPQVRNLVIFLSLLYGMRQVDQNDPMTVNYCRIVFGLYLVLGIAFQGYVTKIVNEKKDTREIEVPPQPALGATPGPPEKKTVMEYDLGQLSTQRTQMLMNSLMVAFFHFKMGQVSPLVMTSVMGIMRFLDDPMFKIHVLGNEAVGALERPFKAESNPLMGWLMGQVNPEAGANGEGAIEGEDDAADDDDDADEGSGDEAEQEEDGEDDAAEESEESKKTK
ncbi:hypothetical protein NDN08_002236 [Rhodosorus marinus]|uniref:Inorganic phosphate transporter n=1 Tax=Rhodosorus marinus TaxID=101924 RepID=A0AAV8UW13_9RHOD|nr:hypothetical protein NDN08_002236 [Rhodosorus marinus]